MGNNNTSTSRVNSSFKFKATLGAFFFFLMPATSETGGAGAMEVGMQGTAQRYIESFHNGADLRVHEQIGTLITAGRVRNSELTLLTKELAFGTSSVREKLVRLLEKTGLELDTIGEKKGRSYVIVQSSGHYL